jgi:hypothetical protein
MTTHQLARLLLDAEDVQVVLWDAEQGHFVTVGGAEAVKVPADYSTGTRAYNAVGIGSVTDLADFERWGITR